MGLWTSLVIVELNDKTEVVSHSEVLAALGLEGYEPVEQVGFCDPRDQPRRSIDLATYNGNLVINDGAVVTSWMEKQNDLSFSPPEQALVSLFPTSEIVSVVAVSTVNGHGYSVIQSGTKVRLKHLATEDPIVDVGPRLPEEQAVYDKATTRDGRPIWTDPQLPDHEFEEDQMLEEFVEAMIQRRIPDVELMVASGEEFPEGIEFTRYKDRSRLKRLFGTR